MSYFFYDHEFAQSLNSTLESVAPPQKEKDTAPGMVATGRRKQFCRMKLPTSTRTLIEPHKPEPHTPAVIGSPNPIKTDPTPQTIEPATKVAAPANLNGLAIKIPIPVSESFTLPRGTPPKLLVGRPVHHLIRGLD
ncbi:hypothetical protein C0991_006514 [Blastosporella zonata]|nr:hypothetical protein C0991_006514 [Blastosporella zonata]